MIRRLACLGLVAACGPGPRAAEPKRDAALDAELRIVDAGPPPPPSVDAAPPPVVACGADAGTCMLPPSQCLDANYLYYFESGTCEAGTCAFSTGTMYCEYGCVQEADQGFCRSGGFT